MVIGSWTKQYVTSAGHSVWWFFVCVFGWTWAFWIAAAVLQISVQVPLGRMLLIVGLLGPALGGIGFACFTFTAQERLEYWLRLVDPRRIGAKWYFVIALLAPALMAIAVGVDILCGGNRVFALIVTRATPILTGPMTLASFLLGILIRGPLLKEPGWRGYALVRLQSTWDELHSSLILGAIWAIYHLPLFFMLGSLHLG